MKLRLSTYPVLLMSQMSDAVFVLHVLSCEFLFPLMTLTNLTTFSVVLLPHIHLAYCLLPIKLEDSKGTYFSWQVASLTAVCESPVSHECSREFSVKMHYVVLLNSVLWYMFSRTWPATHEWIHWIVSGTDYHSMAPVQTKIKFNIRKKRLNSSKLKNGKENANHENKVSSATGICVDHGRKFYECKCEAQRGDFLLRHCLLSYDRSDSDSDTECLVTNHCKNKNGVKKASWTKSVYSVKTDDKSTCLCIHLYFSL